MGGLQRFEQRLEQAISGVFARTFRSAVQPVEVIRPASKQDAKKKLVWDYKAYQKQPENALVPLDCAAWRLTAAQCGSGFEGIVPEFARPAMRFRNASVVSVPAVGFSAVARRAHASIASKCARSGTSSNG